MGAEIAAQVANAGVPVVLLDIVPPGANNRNALAEGAVAKMRKAEPAAFMYDGAAKLIDTGNLEDDLENSATATGSSKQCWSALTSSRHCIASWRASAGPAARLAPTPRPSD